MKKLITVFIILALALFVFEGHGQTDSSAINRVPRNKDNYDKPGHYQVATLVDRSEFNRGDEVHVKVFFTGYGEIGLSKMIIYPSTNIFDTTLSTFSWGFNSKTSTWGEYTNRFTDNGEFIGFGNIDLFRAPDLLHDVSAYADLRKDKGDIQLTTEVLMGYTPRPPIALNLKLKDDCDPGTYVITFYYTYFNGVQWEGETHVANFKVNSFAEQYSTLLTWFGIFGILVTVLGIIPVLPPLIINFYKSVADRARKKGGRHKKP